MKIQSLPSPEPTLASTFFDQRPENTPVDTLVLHSMFAPGAAEPYSAKACKELLDQYQVSAHFFIDRAGAVTCSVDPQYRAWHAGISHMPYPDDQRPGVNAFSIGIELIGAEDQGFSEEQYAAVAQLIRILKQTFPLKNILGHCHIAPERKTDPLNFDWTKLKSSLHSTWPDIDLRIGINT